MAVTQRSISDYDDTADAYLPPGHEGRWVGFALTVLLGGLVAILVSWLLF